MVDLGHAQGTWFSEEVLNSQVQNPASLGPTGHLLTCPHRKDLPSLSEEINTSGSQFVKRKADISLGTKPERGWNFK